MESKTYAETHSVKMLVLDLGVLRLITIHKNCFVLPSMTTKNIKCSAKFFYTFFFVIWSLSHIVCNLANSGNFTLRIYQ